MLARLGSLIGFAALALAGCQGNVVDEGTLSLSETDRGYEGSYAGEKGVVDLASSVLEGDVFEVTLELNGMMLVALADSERGIIEQDGFAVDSGEDTQVLDEDRALLEEFSKVLGEMGERPDALEKTMLFAATLTDYPETMEPTQLVFLDESRRTRLCHMEDQFTPASHDCNKDGWWRDKTTLDYAYVSDHPDVCGGSWDGTAFYVPSGGSFQGCQTKTFLGIGWCDHKNYSIPYAGWWCFEAAHETRIEHAFGNCFGNCGSGCSGDGRNFTQDCLNHDQCVRNGHITASGYCDDQFAATIDDWAGSSCPQ